jgi:hypothetical protein
MAEKGVDYKKLGIFVAAFLTGLVVSRLAAWVINELGLPAAGGTHFAGKKLPSLRRAA